MGYVPSHLTDIAFAHYSNAVAVAVEQEEEEEEEEWKIQRQPGLLNIRRQL